MTSRVDLSQAKVLMVDDTPANIDVLRKVLSVEEYKLFFANSGAKAIQIANRAQPDLILLDVMMPEMDGFETCKHLKSNEVTQEIPVIFITAKTDVDDLIAGFDVGAIDYITKPFKQDEVRVRVRNHLQSYVLLKQRDQLISDLTATEERFRLLADWSSLGIFQTDKDGHVVYANHHWKTIFGATEQQCNNNQWLFCVHETDRQEVQRLWEEVLQTHEEFQTQFRLGDSEDPCWVQTHARAFFYEENQLAGFIGTVEDISHFKRKEELITQEKEAAEAVAKARAEFLAGMAHELRTPLNAIIGYSEMLSSDLESEEDNSKDLGKITQAGKYLLELINDVLDLSKLDADKMPLYLEKFELMPLVQEVITTIMPLAEKNNNSLNVENLESITEMYADQMKVKQILYNLLSNACKFTESGHITLRLQSYEQNAQIWITFEIVDTGIGITEEQMNNIFEKYTQASIDTSKHYGGTGLGLTISQQFCQMMGGNITVTSEDGQGSTFSVHIPATITYPVGDTPTENKE